jgi:hypothetical protein
MRPGRLIATLVLAATAGVLAPAAPAGAQPAATLQVSPRSIGAGGTVVVSGSVGPAPEGSACATSVMLLSRAFPGPDEFAGVPAVVAAVRPDGTFAATTRIPASTPAGTYDITGRCGGGNLGVTATLGVRAPVTPTTAPATQPSATVPPATQPPATAPPTTQPTASTGDDQVDPWVVAAIALVVGVLGGVAGSLLFRRRRPPGPGGPGPTGEG